jgi:hypothetical protein
MNSLGLTRLRSSPYNFMKALKDHEFVKKNYFSYLLILTWPPWLKKFTQLNEIEKKNKHGNIFAVLCWRLQLRNGLHECHRKEQLKFFINLPEAYSQVSDTTTRIEDKSLCKTCRPWSHGWGNKLCNNQNMVIWGFLLGNI